MADLCKCSGDGCPLAKGCMRFLVQGSEMQAHAAFHEQVKTDSDGKAVCSWYIGTQSEWDALGPPAVGTA